MSKPRHKCPTKYCRRNRGLSGSHCSRCQMRKWRAENPDHARLSNLKARAGRKKLGFDLTLDWLIEFLDRNEYDPKLHHIDRISAARGYVKGNLQVLPISENIAKGNRERGAQLQIL